MFRPRTERQDIRRIHFLILALFATAYSTCVYLFLLGCSYRAVIRSPDLLYQ
ncbi:hypothetical protein BDZ89DRAFT_1058123 [Hymenopellis radicata]|nr:hypothetical protein BDZ89DRAFT_1058123 [Hymenopellis radicata]